MEEIFKIIFRTLYSDEFGDTWFFWTLLICFILFPIFAYVLFKTISNIKNGRKNILKITIPFSIFCLFIFYQLIPAGLNFYGVTSLDNKYESLAIKTAIFPYQKGAYYCNLVRINCANNNYKDMSINYEKAFSYLKSYDYPCWGTPAILYYKTIGDYKTAIKVAESLFNGNGKFSIGKYSTLASLYIMDKDYKKALHNLNLYLRNKNQKKSYGIYAARGFVYKQLKQKDLAKKDLEKALLLANNSKEEKEIYDIYNNYTKNALKKELETRKRWGIDKNVK